VNEYVEVEEPRELKRFARALFATIKTKLTSSETRNVGAPNGTFLRKVYFERGAGPGALYWSGGLSEDRAVAENLFGHGAPGSSTELHIWFQFNVPVVKFSRRYGGAFLRHLPTNRIVLAHRGIVTLGHSRVRQSMVFRDMEAWSAKAETSQGARTFLLIGVLNSPGLIEDIGRFAKDLRGAARQPGIAGGLPPEIPASIPAGLLGELRDYFDEPSGERKIKAREQAVADCYHGVVVHELRATFKDSSVLKSREIDLTAITSKRAFLFEVKTSTTPQHIYTAIGQLIAHAAIVENHAKGLPLTKVIVLPANPGERFIQLLTKTLEVCIVTFRRSAEGRITFKGLDALPS
jgi:hypothetical protein